MNKCIVNKSADKINQIKSNDVDINEEKRRHRNWCFTDYNIENYENYEKMWNNKNYKPMEKLCYMVYQMEECPKSKRKHLQGYLECKTEGIGMKQIKKILKNNEIHLEVRKGNQESNIRYCSCKIFTDSKGITKEKIVLKEPVFLGKPKIQGKRTDLLKMYEMLKNGESLIEIRDMYPASYIRYRNKILAVANELLDERTPNFKKVDVEILYGEAGTGKTKEIYERHNERDVYRVRRDDNGAVWFDGYNGQDVIILDDFYGWIKYGSLLEYLDGYKFKLQVKGGFTTKAWSKVYITSNKHPRKWYNNDTVGNIWKSPAFLRRIKAITKYGKNNNEEKLFEAPIEKYKIGGKEITKEEFNKRNIERILSDYDSDDEDDEQKEEESDNEIMLSVNEKYTEETGNTRTVSKSVKKKNFENINVLNIMERLRKEEESEIYISSDDSDIDCMYK